MLNCLVLGVRLPLGPALRGGAELSPEYPQVFHIVVPNMWKTIVGKPLYMGTIRE